MTWSLDSHLSLWVIVFLRHGSIWNSEDLHGLIAAACRGINSFCLDNYVCVQFTWLIGLNMENPLLFINLWCHHDWLVSPSIWQPAIGMNDNGDDEDDIKIFFDFACILLGSLMFVWFSIAFSFKKFVLYMQFDSNIWLVNANWFSFCRHISPHLVQIKSFSIILTSLCGSLVKYDSSFVNFLRLRVVLGR